MLFVCFPVVSRELYSRNRWRWNDQPLVKQMWRTPWWYNLNKWTQAMIRKLIYKQCTMHDCYSWRQDFISNRVFYKRYNILSARRGYVNNILYATGTAKDKILARNVESSIRQIWSDLVLLYVCQITFAHIDMKLACKLVHILGINPTCTLEEEALAKTLKSANRQIWRDLMSFSAKSHWQYSYPQERTTV